MTSVLFSGSYIAGKYTTPDLGPLTATLLPVLYTGICGSGLGYLLYNLSIRKIGPARTSSFVYSVIKS